jgi:hypothetical protein
MSRETTSQYLCKLDVKKWFILKLSVVFITDQRQRPTQLLAYVRHQTVPCQQEVDLVAGQAWQEVAILITVCQQN